MGVIIFFIEEVHLEECLRGEVCMIFGRGGGEFKREG